MPQRPRRTLMILLVAVVAVGLIAALIGGFMAFLSNPSGNSQGSQANGNSQATPTATLQPTPTPADNRSVVVEGVSVTLIDFSKSTDPKGIEVTIDLYNQSKNPLAFTFDPGRNLTLSDNMGSNYDFRWAEYAGEVKLDSGKRMQLTKAFFGGPNKDGTPEKYTVILVGLPQIGKATWQVDWPANSTKLGDISAVLPEATPAPTTTPDKPAIGLGDMVTQNKLSLTLAEASYNPDINGLEIAFFILNNGAGDMSFPFEPAKTLSIVDNRGTVYNLKWAEFDGSMKVAKGQQVRLVKAYFDGPISDPLTNQLTITVSGIPDFGKASWQVPIQR